MRVFQSNKAVSDAMLDHGFQRPEAIETTANRLVPEFWKDLRRLARRERRRVGAGQTLQTTALVSEAWLKLRNKEEFVDDNHFLRASALAMRCVLIDHARARASAKRGVADTREIDETIEPFWQTDERLIELNDALLRLGALSPRLAEIVELRFFGGYTEEQTADLLGVTDRTIRRDWMKARGWLYREMGSMLTRPTDAVQAVA